MIGSKGCSPSSLPAITGRPLVEQADQRAQQPGLALAALAEQHHVVAGDQRPLELRDDGVVEAVQAGPGVLTGAQLRQQVVADLLPERLLDVAARAQLTDGGGSSHAFTLAPAVKNRRGSPICQATSVTPVVAPGTGRRPGSGGRRR